MTYGVSHRVFRGNRLYTWFCVTCQTDTAHQRSHCIVCKTVSVSPMRKGKELISGRARASAIYASKTGGFRGSASSAYAGIINKRINFDKRAAARRAAEESRARWEGKPPVNPETPTKT